MLSLVGNGEITPLTSTVARENGEVVVGDSIRFSPLAARLLAEVDREVAIWSTGLGLTRTRFLSLVSGEHEKVALRIAAGARKNGSHGVFQIAEKRRTETSLTPLFRMPVFTMWEAFTFHEDRHAWLSLARAACEWLASMTYSDVSTAISENTLMPTEAAEEYVLLDPCGEERYLRSDTGRLVNSSAWPAGLPEQKEVQVGLELGNSYSLGGQGDQIAAAHSIGLDRLVGAMLVRRPADLLDWKTGPIAVTGVRFESRLDAKLRRRLIEAPRLIVLASGEDEAKLRDSTESRLPTASLVSTDAPDDSR